ncbi:MAG: MotA/TolQ/ExbB proton channel family protein [Isosphaeraceae bacterium]
MARSAHDSPRLGYLVALAMLVLALLFPIGLMVFNPTLMFQRGWEQYVGTAIYLWAVVTLGRELWRLWRNENAFDEAARLLQYIGGALKRGGSAPGTGQGSGEVSAIAAGLASDGRILHVRVRQLVGNVREMHTPSASQLMEVNREASGLDQEHMAGRFTLTRYILYLLPVIGFIGTVEGISKALMNISKVLPLVKDLDAFLNNLTGVTSALQIAFDSTLLALFLSAALMLAQTLVYRRSEALLARVDGWVVEHVLPGVGTKDPFAERLDELIGPHVAQLRSELATILAPAAQSLQAEAAKIGQNLKAPIAQLAASMDQFPRSMAAFQQGAEAIGRIGNKLEVLETAGEAMGQGAATLSRIERALAQSAVPDPQLEDIKRGLDRATEAIESLSDSWSSAYEKSSRTTQEQLASTMSNLKDALELINVSIEQGNSLYRNIVKKMFDERAGGSSPRSDSVRAA